LTREEWTEALRHGDHALHLYADEKEKFQVIGDLLSWLDKDEGLALIVENAKNRIENADPKLRGSLREALRSGKLNLFPSKSFYLPRDSFSIDGIISSREKLREELNDLGFKKIMISGDISWVSANKALFDHFMRYEAHTLVHGLPEGITALCQYDRRAFLGGEISKVRNVHELEVSGERLFRNFWMMTRGLR
jgi:hypothetical protein